MNDNPKFKIGLQFTRVTGKRKDLETIIDILKTYNSKNELVKLRYVTTHYFMNQLITDRDVLELTIQRATSPTRSYNYYESM